MVIRLCPYMRKSNVAFLVGTLWSVFVFAQPVFAQSTDGARAKSLAPVKRIVMFNSGITQVVREAVIKGAAELELLFDEDVIDDVLKSIVFEDKKGRIRAVEYQPAPARTDLAAQKLSNPLTVAQLIQRYRGERITLKLEASSPSGRILGVESRQGETSQTEYVTLMSEKGAISSYPLPKISEFVFDSEDVREEFQLGMIGLTRNRHAEQKKLKLVLAGEGERTVRFAYVIDSPIWRVTYRLDLRSGRASLQGWAHVDNVSGSDWEGVVLDLRSGRPQAFHASVFAPLLARRNRVGTSVFGLPADLDFAVQSVNRFIRQPLAPANWFDGKGGGGFGGGGFGGGLGGGLGGGGALGGSTNLTDQPGLDISSSVDAAATQGRASQMVRFVVRQPIELATGKSAMIPVMESEFDAKLVTRFQLSNESPVAELVVKFANESPYSLLAGPIAIYQEGGFAGDAKLKRTDIDDKVELVYGIDQPVAIKSSLMTPVRVIDEVNFAEGEFSEPMVRMKGTQMVKRAIELSNKDINKRTFLVKFDFGAATTTPKPNDVEGTIGSFLFDVEAGQDVERFVVLSTPIEETRSIRGLTPSFVSALKNGGAEIADAVLELAEQIQELDSKIAKVELSQRHISELRSELKSEQSRFSRMIESLKSDPTAQQKFVDKLVTSEKELSQHNESFSLQQTKLSQLKQELANLLDARKQEE